MLFFTLPVSQRRSSKTVERFETAMIAMPAA